MLNQTIKKLLIAMLSIIVLTSCMKEEKKPAPSMEEIQKKEGLPVQVVKLHKTLLEKKMSFFTTLSGIKESTQGTSFAERVKKINAKIGDNVRQGKVIIEFPEDMPQIQYTQAKLAFENAEKLFKRTKNLYEAGETSQQNYDNAKMNYEVSKRNFESMKQMIYIEAPFNGTITKLFVEEGEIPPALNPGMPRPLFIISQLNTIKAKINANLEEVSKLKLGMKASLIYNGKEYTGKVVEISPAIDPQTQAFSVEIHFPNPRRELTSGITAEIFIKTYSNPNAISIPRNLLINEFDKHYVFVEKNGIAEKREIQIGEENGISAEVLSGLDVGENLINCCKTQLKDGMKVKVIQ